MADDKKICENCKFFSRYYVKESTSLQRVPREGRCNNFYKITATEAKKVLKKGIPCEFWEPVALQVNERKENVLLMLKEMSRKLDEIALILRDDKNVSGE